MQKCAHNIDDKILISMRIFRIIAQTATLNLTEKVLATTAFPNRLVAAKKNSLHSAFLRHLKWILNADYGYHDNLRNKVSS